MSDYYMPYICHSAKGQTWKNHKYIRKENGRYIYPKPKRGVNDTSSMPKRAYHRSRYGLEPTKDVSVEINKPRYTNARKNEIGDKPLSACEKLKKTGESVINGLKLTGQLASELSELLSDKMKDVRKEVYYAFKSVAFNVDYALWENNYSLWLKKERWKNRKKNR